MRLGLFKKRVKAEDICTSDELQSFVYPQNGKSPCAVYVNSTRKRIYRDIDDSLIPNDSLPRWYGGCYRHFLGLDKDGLYTIGLEDTANEENSPQSLAIVLKKFEVLMPKAFPMKTSIVEKVKIGLLILFCFVELIILFLIISQFAGA